MTDRHEIITEVCRMLSGGNDSQAERVLSEEYPFRFENRSARACGDRERLGIFVRDGFVDRYSGAKLIFPPVLRLLSTKFPHEFPYHRNWKMSECHLAYWELIPTVDHVIPVARGGPDCESNWVCTSQLRNSAKSNWLLEELGWELWPPGDMDQWDGLLAWYVEYSGEHELLLQDSYFSNWRRLARQALEE